MDKYQETFQTWNKIAKVYEDKFMDLTFYNDSYNAFLDLIKGTPPSVLEIGCGPGNITKYLLAKKPDLSITGTDIAENMIELASKNNPSAEFKVLDAREIRSLDQKYDAIVCGFCIPYLSKNDCHQLIEDCTEILNKDGILYLSFVVGDYEKSSFITGSSGDRTYFYYHSKAEMEKTLLSYSFEIVNHFEIDYEKADGSKETHTALISKKH
ncbi:MAG: class I SAM-dependent methyltransferase [Crocinitomicaceae bacterium]|nr:class I SAM-dependent methyltransferase [Crocinitomicaceae bacterium]